MGLLAVGLAVFWAGVGLYVLHPILPYNPLRLPFAAEVKASFWVPEGWAFFTRDPRGDLLTLMRLTPDGWVPAGPGVQSEARYAFGIMRHPRAENSEALRLVKQVPSSAWAVCEGGAAPCLDGMETSLRTESPSARPTLCGTVGLVKRPQVPWAWSRGPTPAQMRGTVARVEVAC